MLPAPSRRITQSSQDRDSYEWGNDHMIGQSVSRENAEDTVRTAAAKGGRGLRRD